MEATKAILGTVKSIKLAQGFGFIHGMKTALDYWFHASYLKNVSIDQLHEHDEVEFIPEYTPKGWRALDVYVVEEEKEE